MQVNFYQNSKVEVTSKVFPGVESDKITASSNEDTLSFKDQNIPEGARLLIEADNDNSGSIYVGDDSSQDYRLPAGGTVDIAVGNMQIPTVRFPNSDDIARAIVEVDQ